MTITDGQVGEAELRRRINDVVALSTLSAIWAGASRAEIAQSLSEVLQKTLRADLVYVGLRETASSARCEGVCIGEPEEIALRDGIVMPIGIHAEYGTIVISSAAVDFPSETDRLLLNLAANQATVALLTERVREEQRVTEILQRIGIAVAAELDSEKVIQTVTDETTALTGANFGAFFYNVVNEAGQSLMLYTLSGAPREAFSTFPMPRNTPIFAPTFAGTGVVRSNDITGDPRYGHNPPSCGATWPFLCGRAPARSTGHSSSGTGTSACSTTATSGWPSASPDGRRSPWITGTCMPKRSAPTWRRIISSPPCRTSCGLR
jgi:hypothetical protein